MRLEDAADRITAEHVEVVIVPFAGRTADSPCPFSPTRPPNAEVRDNTAALAVAVKRTGCDVAQARMSELERDMQPIAEEIIAAPATSLGGLRAKALVALWEAYPAHASHTGEFEFGGDDGGASRALFDAVAVMTGLMPLVSELEARLAADVEFKGVDA